MNESLVAAASSALLDLAGAVATLAQFANAGGLDVVADGGVATAEFDGERQADVAQADHADLEVSQVEFAHARAETAFLAGGKHDSSSIARGCLDAAARVQDGVRSHDARLLSYKCPSIVGRYLYIRTLFRRGATTSRRERTP